MTPLNRGRATGPDCSDEDLTMFYAFSAPLSSYPVPPKPERGDSVPEIFGQLVLSRAIGEPQDYFTGSDSK